MSDPFGVKSRRRANELQEEAVQLQRQGDNLRAAQEKRNTVRQARIARGRALNAASSQGVATSSAAQGGVGSITSQFSSNLSFLDNQNLISDQASETLGQARRYEQKAQRAGAIWKLGTQLASKAIFG